MLSFYRDIGLQQHPCELKFRTRARKSLVANRDISKGNFITLERVSIKRPGIGISPFLADLIVRGTALEDLKEDTIIKFDKIKFVNKIYSNL